MKNIVVLYHYPCLDGFTAAWAAKKFFGDEAEYIPADYSGKVNVDLSNKEVYFVDYSFKRPRMMEVARVAKRVIVLDHHKSAIEDLAELYEQGVIEGVFDLHRSGAGITWDYFFSDLNRPPMVDYVEDRDLWRYALPNSREVNYALFSHEYNFDTWDQLAETPINTLIAEGIAIWRKHMKDVQELSQQSRLMSIGGHVVPVVNVNYTYGSEVGNILAQGQKFAGYYWIGNDGGYNFGLRSTDDGLDVSEIAIRYGGGGHRNAAGFKVRNLGELWGQGDVE